jgi:hypothetical protein
MRVRARCSERGLSVDLGLPPDAVVVVATADFLATGGAFGGLDEAAVELLEGTSLREEMVRALRARGGTLRPGDSFDRRRPRIELPARRPLRCLPDSGK